jgi:hypothetical protein
MQYQASRPNWWTTTHDTAWERTKAALRRDWEQTKRDLGGQRSGKELNQDMGDTMRQASGKQALPPGNVPNPPDAADIRQAEHKAEKQVKKAEKQQRRWEDSEDAVRYGYGAGMYKDRDWDVSIEPELRNEWSSLNADRPWEDYRDDVRFGWDQARSNARRNV